MQRQQQKQLMRAASLPTVPSTTACPYAELHLLAGHPTAGRSAQQMRWQRHSSTPSLHVFAVQQQVPRLRSRLLTGLPQRLVWSPGKPNSQASQDFGSEQRLPSLLRAAEGGAPSDLWGPGETWLLRQKGRWIAQAPAGLDLPPAGSPPFLFSSAQNNCTCWRSPHHLTANVSRKPTFGNDDD